MVAAARWRSLDQPALPLTSVVLTVGRLNRSEPVEPILSAHIDFTLEGTLYDFNAAASPYANGQKVRALGKVLSSHSEWTDKQVAAAVTAAGARFGPDRQRELQQELERLFQGLGKVLGKMKPGALLCTNDDTPEWSLDVVVSTPIGDLTYGASVEPFDGRLYFLSRVGRQ